MKEAFASFMGTEGVGRIAIPPSPCGGGDGGGVSWQTTHPQ